jgi:hypothetical protein
MSLTNYGELKTAIGTRLSRSNMTALIPDFVTVAHFKMMRGDRLNQMPSLRIDDMLTESDLTLSSGSVALPAAYLERKSLYLSDTNETAMTFMPVARFNRLGAKTQSGVPAFYTIKGSTLIVAPTSSDTVKFYYYASLDQPSADSDTNAIFTKAPHAYLYGALAEAYDHIRQMDRAQYYRQQFVSAVLTMNEESADHEFAGDALSMHADNVT